MVNLVTTGSDLISIWNDRINFYLSKLPVVTRRESGSGIRNKKIRKSFDVEAFQVLDHRRH